MSSEYPSAQPVNPPPPAAPLPPPIQNPPPWPPSPPPPKKSATGCGFWIVAALAVLFFGTTIILFIAFVGMSVRGGDGRSVGLSDDQQFVEQTVEGQGQKKILLIPITGIISDVPRSDLFHAQPGMVASVHDMLAVARKDADIKAVLLDIDSPGGGITASDVIYHEIQTFHEQTGKEVVSVFDDVAASGAYYIASASGHIVAHPTTVTGSIGVIMPMFGLEDLFGKIGIKSRPIMSGKMKDIGSLFRDMRPEERQMLQGMVDAYYDRFVTIVGDGMKARGVQITRAELEKYCDGSVFTGEQAKKIGFVDEIGYFEDAVRATCDRAKIKRDEARVIMYRHRPGLLEMLMARSSAPAPQGVTLRLGGSAADETPRFLYLWSVGETGVRLETSGK